MLKLSVRRVRAEQVDRLRWWMGELNRRNAEVLETFRQEGVRHEQAYLLDAGNERFLLYLTEVENLEAAGRAYAASSLSIDAEHRRIMAAVAGERVAVELLYEAVLPA